MNVSLVSQDAIVEKFTENQLHVFWLPDEIKVEKDIQDILVNMTESEKHGVITTLKLFSLYEFEAGSEYWGGRFKKIFPNQIEFLQMAATFAMFELAIHLPFYKKLNELLYLDSNEFYDSYIKDETLSERIGFIEAIIDSRDDLLSLALFSIVEGAILYSSFAFLKHFQSQGKNKLMNVVRGINFSVRDENLHSIASAYCFRKKLSETDYNEDQIAQAYKRIYDGATKLFEHESRIVDMIFEKGKIDGITELQMKNFVKSRINICLKELGLEPLYEVDYNPIADYFYDSINGFQYNDFFTSIGAAYNRNWSETEFKW